MDPSLAYLVLGSLGAVGAALAIGTLGALVRYHRTGELPGETDGGETAAAPSRGQVVGLWLRVAVGTALAAWAVVAISRAGLL